MIRVFLEINQTFIEELKNHISKNDIKIIQLIGSFPSSLLFSISQFIIEKTQNDDLMEIKTIYYDQKSKEINKPLVIIFPNKSFDDIPKEVKQNINIPDIFIFGSRSDCPVVISIHKAGTNLIHRLFKAVGYEIIGDGAKESYDDIKEVLTKNKQIRREGSIPFNFLVSKFAGKNIALSTHGIRLELDTTTMELGESLGKEYYSPEPKGPLWNWIKSGKPPLIFNYRDPRDVLVSFVHYLESKPTSVYWFEATATILKSLPTMEKKLDYLIRCTPRYLDLGFRQHYWLLYHPNVTKVSFEELVGTQGGGDRHKQIWAILRVMSKLGVSGIPEEILKNLFSSKSRTFRKGQIGSWKETFSQKNVEEFNKRYEDILDIYGYATIL